MRTDEFAITVNKADLLAKLRENRAAHSATYDKAWEGYERVIRQELEDKLDRIKAHKPVERWLGGEAPEDHTSDYDDVIEMLEMGLGNTIDLTQGQFRQYVKDDWGWRAAWITSNSKYLEAR